MIVQTYSDKTKQDKFVNPLSTVQTVVADDGYIGLSTVTINGDANLVPENIRKGIEIFGVVGTYEPE